LEIIICLPRIGNVSLWNRLVSQDAGSYATQKNRLRHVFDWANKTEEEYDNNTDLNTETWEWDIMNNTPTAGEGTLEGDKDFASQKTDNYTYDEIGNLIKDEGEGILNIDWTVYGKVRKVTKTNGASTSYRYDAAGNRVLKSVVVNGNTKNTYYVRDASGNVMAIYESKKLKEQPIYGSSRLGMYRVDASGGTKPLERTLGNKLYELSNHLGNVLAVITDNKYGVDANEDGNANHYAPHIVSSTDYYPFGLGMDSRTLDEESEVIVPTTVFEEKTTTEIVEVYTEDFEKGRHGFVKTGGGGTMELSIEDKSDLALRLKVDNRKDGGIFQPANPEGLKVSKQLETIPGEEYLVEFNVRTGYLAQETENYDFCTTNYNSYFEVNAMGNNLFSQPWLVRCGERLRISFVATEETTDLTFELRIIESEFFETPTMDLVADFDDIKVTRKESTTNWEEQTKLLARSLASEKYRYGFNGKENDTDFGNKQVIQDYGFRVGCTIGRKKFVDFLDFNLSVLFRNFSIQIHYSSTHCWFFCK
jgi:hypothetical protein